MISIKVAKFGNTVHVHIKGTITVFDRHIYAYGL